MRGENLIKDVIIIGGGPAGLMAANQLKGTDFLLLEKNEQVGKKLMLTGGKRCNITNVLSKEAFMASLNSKKSKFLYKALTQFGREDIIGFFRDRALNLKLEQDFKFFPETEKSRDVLNSLLRDIEPGRIHYNQAVREIHKEDYYVIKTKTDTYYTKNLILCVGSNAYPSTGSSGDILKLLEPFNVGFKQFSPAEAPIYLKNNEVYKDLQGISLSTELKMSTRKQTFKGDVIFTHFGLSGPLILHISELIDEDLAKGPVSLSFSLTTLDFDKVLNETVAKNSSVLALLESLVQKRLAKYVLDALQIENVRLKELSSKKLNAIKDRILKFTVEVSHVEVKEKSFVNAGGILLEEINPNTMALKNHDGLYIAGESMDLAGPIGGFNITIALSTGHLAGQSVKQKLKGA